MSGCLEITEFSQKNKPQGNALSGGVFVLLVSGIQIAWIFDTGVDKLSWAEGRSKTPLAIAFMSFYIAGALGLFAASATINRLTKSNIYFTALIFMTFASGMLIFVPHNFYVVVVARVMMGFGHGYAYLTALVHASEIVHQRLRGMIIAAFQMCIVSSAMLASSLSNSLTEGSLVGFQWIGIVCMIYSALGIAITIFLTRESPVALIREKKFDQALDIMIRVRNETSETWSIRNEFTELQTMVEEDEQTSKGVLEDGNVRPLVLITLLKVAFVLSLNYGLGSIRMRYTSAFETETGYNLAPLVFLTIRLLTMLVTLFSIEINGRRIHFVISHVATGILLGVFAVVVMSKPDNFGYGFEVLNLLIEVAAGLGMGIVADVYTSEAFNTVKKSRSIFVTTCVEFGLHALLIFTTYGVTGGRVFDGIYLMASGVLLLTITVLLYRQLPETSKMSIRQTRTEFLRSGEIVFSGSNKMPPNSIYE